MSKGHQPYKMREFKARPTEDQMSELRPIIPMRRPHATLDRGNKDPREISYAAIISKIKPDSRWAKIRRNIADYIRTLVT